MPEKLTIPINDVSLWDNNPREISTKDFQSLKNKIKRWGLWKPFLVWESKKRIIGGNQRYKACKELGHPEIWVEYREPKDEAEALEMAITDNESSGEWIKPFLIEQIQLHQESINLDDYKITIKDSTLQDIMPIDVEEDDPPNEEDIKSVTVLGDLYELNGHRVLCGDSTMIDQVEKLMNGKKADMVFTDPPYNVDYGGNQSPIWKKSIKRIQNDNLTSVNWEKFCQEIIGIIKFANKGPIYVCHAPGPDGRIIAGQLDKAFHWSATIIWKKDRLIPGRGHFQRQYEPIWYGWDGSHKDQQDRTATDVWEISRAFSNDKHPTMKPIALMVKALIYSSFDNWVILDLFLGSGSTLIACEKTDRICYGMEIDPHYCDIIVARWAKFMLDEGKEFSIKRNGEVVEYNQFIKGSSKDEKD